jgi:6-phosphofructokinase 2
MARFVTFTPNPALDIATSVERLVDAHKLRCEAPLVHPGGGGINVARVLHRLGSDVLALYPAGGSTGERLHRLMHDEGVPALRQPIAGDTRESFTVHERTSGREYRFVLPGPTLSATEWAATLACLRQLSPAPAWVIASGSLPPGVPDDGHAQIAQVAREIGARMVVDTSGPALAAALQAGVWLIKPSLRELAGLAGGELNTPAQRLQAARALIGCGQVQVVALSLGSEGAMLITAEQCLQADALDVPVVGSVGAGDSFLAALVQALDTQSDLTQALSAAMAAGAAAVMLPGTALCQPQDVARLRAQVHLHSGV